MPSLRTWAQLLVVNACTAGLRVLGRPIISWLLHSAISSGTVGITILARFALFALVLLDESELALEEDELEEMDVISLCESLSELGRLPVPFAARVLELVLVLPEERRSFGTTSYK